MAQGILGKDSDQRLHVICTKVADLSSNPDRMAMWMCELTQIDSRTGYWLKDGLCSIRGRRGSNNSLKNGFSNRYWCMRKGIFGQDGRREAA
eukprot:767735-Hanusia_phi.AAC.2